MAYGCYTEKDARPDAGQALAAVGAAAPQWAELVDWLTSLTRTAPSWRFYGCNYGWALAFKKGGRALAALFPDRERLTVLVVLTGEQADLAVADAALSTASHELIASLPRFKEGCWVFRPVADERGAADARRLIALRAGGRPG
jgi:Protein of unknown function (DUF3788)